MRSRALWASSFLLATLCTAGNAAEKRAITHEAMWTLPRVAAPVLSKDGSFAVFSVTQASYQAADTRSDLWRIQTDGKSAPQQLTQHPGVESQPNISPDGRWLAFVAKRDGDEATQIYLMDLQNAGDARRLTQIPTGARGPKFSPDGTQLLFQSDVYPAAMNDADNQAAIDERKARKYQVRSYDGFPIRNWDRWLDERQVHVFALNLADGKSTDLLAGSALVKAPGFAGRSELSVPTLDPLWSPDGRSIVFVASSNANLAAHAQTHLDLYEVTLRSRAMRRLTGANGAIVSYSKPQFSADGAQLLALAEPRGEKLYNSTVLASFAWPSMQSPQQIWPAGGRSLDSFVAAPKARERFGLVEDASHIQLESLHDGAKTSTRLSTLNRGMYSDLQIAGQANAALAIALYQSASEPAEVVRINLKNGSSQRLTRFTEAAVAALDLAPVESFWSDSPRGVKVHNLLLRPPGFDPQKKYPLLVLIHGGPHGMWRDTFFLRWNYHLLAAPGYVVLMTNYTGSTGFGAEFAQAIQGDPFKTPAEEINRAADAAIEKYAFIDANRQCAGGASYGGHLANWLQGTTTRYRCLISHAGLINLESQWGTSDVIFEREVSNGGPPWEQGAIWREQNPIRLAAQFKTPVLVTVGEQDFRVPLNNSLEYWSVLQRLQIPSRLLVYPTEDHWIMDGENSRHYYGELAAWLKRWMADEAVAVEAQ